MTAKVRKIVCWVLGAFGLFIIAIMIINIFNNDKFWEINVFNGITMLWTVGMSFILTQGFSKYQRKSEIMLKLIQELLTIIDEAKTCNLAQGCATKESILMQNRQINNQIALISNHANKFGIDKDLSFISEKFKEYEEFVGEHIEDLQYLSQSRTQLARPIGLMRGRLYKIMMDI